MSSSPAKLTLKSASKTDSKSSPQANPQSIDDALKVLKPAELRILLIGQLYTEQAIKVRTLFTNIL